MTVALFTPFSPEIGGGGALLRSILPELADLDVKWYYLAHQPSPSRESEWLGAPLRTDEFLGALFQRAWHLPKLGHAIDHMCADMKADRYWVVAHNEGVLVAADLLAAGQRVHLSVHDDPAVIFSRSRKYRSLVPVIAPLFATVLRGAATVDVIGTGMQEEYRSTYGRDCATFYRFAAALAERSK